jgi:hypothetical protein
MYVPYNETICRLCTFNDGKKDTVSEPLQIGEYGTIRYINCLRDNEEAKERFCRTLKKENNLWYSQIINFEKCLFDRENISSWLEKKD